MAHDGSTFSSQLFGVSSSARPLEPWKRQATVEPINRRRINVAPWTRYCKSFLKCWCTRCCAITWSQMTLTKQQFLYQQNLLFSSSAIVHLLFYLLATHTIYYRKSNVPSRRPQGQKTPVRLPDNQQPHHRKNQPFIFPFVYRSCLQSWVGSSQGRSLRRGGGSCKVPKAALTPKSPLKMTPRIVCRWKLMMHPGRRTNT